METTSNIWDNFNFSEKLTKSAYDYLLEQKSGIIAATRGELLMEVETYSDQSSIITHVLYVVAPNLGNYRKQIVKVLEFEKMTMFPVDIIAEEITYKKVKEEDFLNKISEMLLEPTVKRGIENLYSQSKENKK
jgi:hypothetical protein